MNAPDVMSNRDVLGVRFWSRVNRDGPIADIGGRCWEWIGHTDRLDGRGRMFIGGRSLSAQRVSLFLLRCAWPQFKVAICCGNALCVNPAHLDSPVDESDYFWRRVNKYGPVHPILGTKCWEWAGQKNSRSGYGTFVLAKQKAEMAHRAAWRLTKGSPADLLVLHHCDNRICVNPSHLFEGNYLDNMRDMKAKGRGNHQFGELARAAKLTREQVSVIKAAKVPKPVWGQHLARDLANHYGVTEATIYNVWSGKGGWRDS